MESFRENEGPHHTEVPIRLPYWRAAMCHAGAGSVWRGFFTPAVKAFDRVGRELESEPV